ncbi:MAG: RluA family pseudouridine synthase [Candidatus Pacebacteria bacterium]|nr:RluA family pseudouridine synthase [Candidatus Paceibacterota bacterium]
MESPQVIYENKDFLILNKPAGLLVHPAPGKEQENSLVDWLLKNYPEVWKVGDEPATRPGIVHRLDKDTSGIILIPRNQKTFEYFKDLFQSHKIKKTYLALVVGNMKQESGIINQPIGIKDGTMKRSAYSSKMQKPAVTEYKVVKRVNIGKKEFTLLEVSPRTGRTHQIRVHLNFIGYPVVGDKLYGGSRTKLKGLSRQFLHAWTLEFTAPDGNRMKFEADLPPELKSFLE